VDPVLLVARESVARLPGIARWLQRVSASLTRGDRDLHRPLEQLLPERGSQRTDGTRSAVTIPTRQRDA